MVDARRNWMISAAAFAVARALRLGHSNEAHARFAKRYQRFVGPNDARTRSDIEPRRHDVERVAGERCAQLRQRDAGESLFD